MRYTLEQLARDNAKAAFQMGDISRVEYIRILQNIQYREEKKRKELPWLLKRQAM